MFGNLYKWWPAIAVTMVYYAVLYALVVTELRHTEGHLTYPLDDPYIHMAIAKNFAESHVWGVTSYAFGSSTSSPLWTALLGVGYIISGANQWLPVMLNILAGTILIFYLFHLLRRDAGPMGSFLYLLLIVAATSLPSLTLVGMEHVLHSLMNIMFIFLGMQVATQYENNLRTGYALLLLAALLPMIRYKGLFAVALVFLFLCSQRRFRFALPWRLRQPCRWCYMDYFPCHKAGYSFPTRSF